MDRWTNTARHQEFRRTSSKYSPRSPSCDVIIYNRWRIPSFTFPRQTLWLIYFAKSCGECRARGQIKIFARQNVVGVMHLRDISPGTAIHQPCFHVFFVGTSECRCHTWADSWFWTSDVVFAIYYSFGLRGYPVCGLYRLRRKNIYSNSTHTHWHVNKVKIIWINISGFSIEGYIYFLFSGKSNTLNG